jgi:hypothetical protein
MTGEKSSERDMTEQLASFGQSLYQADQAAGAHKPKRRKKSDPNQPKKQKELKDPHAPKSVLNNYLLYCKLQREANKNESQPPSKQALADSWNAFNDTQKAVFTAKVDKYKVQYAKALSTYVQTEEYEVWTKKDDEAKKDYIMEFNRDQAATGVAANAQGANQDSPSGKYQNQNNACIEIYGYERADSAQPTQAEQTNDHVKHANNELQQAKLAKKHADSDVINQEQHLKQIQRALQIASEALMKAFQNREATTCRLNNAQAKHEAALKEEALKEEALKEEALKEAALKEAALKEAALEQEALEQAALRQREALEQAALKQQELVIRKRIKDAQNELAELHEMNPKRMKQEVIEVMYINVD